MVSVYIPIAKYSFSNILLFDSEKRNNLKFHVNIKDMYYLKLPLCPYFGFDIDSSFTD